MKKPNKIRGGRVGQKELLMELHKKKEGRGARWDRQKEDKAKLKGKKRALELTGKCPGQEEARTKKRKLLGSGSGGEKIKTGVATVQNGPAGKKKIPTPVEPMKG